MLISVSNKSALVIVSLCNGMMLWRQPNNVVGKASMGSELGLHQCDTAGVVLANQLQSENVS